MYQARSRAPANLVPQITNKTPTCLAALALLVTITPAGAEPPDADSLYFYRAVITEVYDGDTVTADVDLGFSVWL